MLSDILSPTFIVCRRLLSQSTNELTTFQEFRCIGWRTDDDGLSRQLTGQRERSPDHKIQRDLRRNSRCTVRQAILNEPRKFTWFMNQDSRWNAGRTRCWPYVTVYQNPHTDEIYLSLPSPGVVESFDHRSKTTCPGTGQEHHCMKYRLAAIRCRSTF